MLRKRRSYKPSSPRVVAPRSSKRQGKTKWKGILQTTFMWALVAVNAVLIISFVQRLVVREKPPETTIVAPATNRIQVEVLNGCGTKGVAKEITDFLRNREFDVVKFENYDRFDIKETFVIDRASMEKENAKKVAEALGVNPSRVVPQLSEDRHLQVTVVIGQDYPRLKVYQGTK